MSSHEKLERGILPKEFTIKDSGERLQFGSGMQRDTTEGKINWLLIRPGPMLRRWATHLSTAAAKYDTERNPGEPRNWQLASGVAEYERFQESAARHFEQWLAGERDEDHAAAVFFNINGAEYVRDKMIQEDDLDQLRKEWTPLPPGNVLVDDPAKLSALEAFASAEAEARAKGVEHIADES